MMGCAAFQAAQKEACTCVPATDVRKATRSRLLRFLKAAAAPAAELQDAAVDALLQKYSGQEPKMFFRLLKKYPEALKMDAGKEHFMNDLFKGKFDGFQETKKKGDFGVGLKEEDPMDGYEEEVVLDDDIRSDEHIEL